MKIKLPELKKSIIDDFQTCSFENLRERTADYKWVSFDIFDTLIKRDVPDPKDVFGLVEKKSKYRRFAELRIKAENLARSKDPFHEPDLNDIYRCIDIRNRSERERLKQTELSIERRICVLNKDLIEFYNYCTKNKRVLLISDMYLPKAEIEYILSKNKIYGYEKIYISSERKQNKQDGGLFETALNENGIGKHEIVHIGNSFRVDLAVPLLYGIDSIKVSSSRHSTGKNYVDIFGAGDKYQFLLKFLENHTSGDDQYYQFGFERLGPLLCGFSIWLARRLKDNHNQSAVFLSRDGYLLKTAYDLLGFNKIVPSFYFELSRRSLRVPLIRPEQGFEEIITELPLPSRTNMRQVIDALGLEPDQYTDILQRFGFDLDSHIRRKDLVLDDHFNSVFEEIKNDIFSNACDEYESMIKYFSKKDYWENAGIVDIGWGGSIQKYLIQILASRELTGRVNGYYLGLTYKAHEKTSNSLFKAQGYLFDRFNFPDDYKDMERPFVGLFETLFPEQKGSVKRYQTCGDDVTAVRYPYEYEENGKFTWEAKAIQKVQKGAINYVKQLCKSPLLYIIGDDKKVAFSNLYQTGINPGMEDVRLFGDFAFFNNGTKIALASPEKTLEYALHPGKLKDDLFDSQWKVGFLKGVFKVPFPYIKVYEAMNFVANYGTAKQ